MSPSSESRTDPASALLAAVQRAFPDRPELGLLGNVEGYQRLWQNLVTASALDETALARRLASALGLGFAANLDSPQSAVLALVPAQFCYSQKILPLRLDQRTLVVATGNPFDDALSEKLQFLVNRPVQWELAAPDAIEIAATVAYGREALRLASTSVSELGLAMAGAHENAIVVLGRSMLVSAIE